MPEYARKYCGMCSLLRVPSKTSYATIPAAHDVLDLQEECGVIRYYCQLWRQDLQYLYNA